MTKDSAPFESHHSFNGKIEIYILEDIRYSITIIVAAIAHKTMYELHY